MSQDKPIIPITADLTLAAPDLYLALEEITEHYRQMTQGKSGFEVLSNAYTALAKANGVKSEV